MQEVFEKIKEKIRKEIEDVIVKDTYTKGKNAGLRKAEVFVDEVAAEYNNSWISCSERLPEENDSMFARFKGTDKWRDSMFEKTSNEVAVTIADDKGDKATTHAHTSDGTWKCDILRACPTYRVIAWQPFPAPYQPKGEIDG